MDLTTIIIGGAISALFSFLVGIALYRTQKQSERMSEISKSIVTLQNTAVNDEHVRRVIREEVQQLNTMLPKVLDALREIQTDLAEQKGYQAGQIAAQRRSNDSHQ